MGWRRVGRGKEEGERAKERVRRRESEGGFEENEQESRLRVRGCRILRERERERESSMGAASRKEATSRRGNRTRKREAQAPKKKKLTKRIRQQVQHPSLVSRRSVQSQQGYETSCDVLGAKFQEIVRDLNNEGWVSFELRSFESEWTGLTKVP